MRNGSYVIGTKIWSCSRECYLTFSPTADNLLDSLASISIFEEDQEVQKRQAAEDLMLYGSRVEPPESVEVDEIMKLANLPPKRSASEFGAAVSRPAKVRKKSDSQKYNNDRVTAMDWHCGTSPLDAWLNQSALPSVLPMPHLSSQSTRDRHVEEASLETEQIRSFRRIHLGVYSEPAVPALGLHASWIPHDVSMCDSRTQIYHRNIVDRYPALPHYLALRLAKANCDRAERLQQSRSMCTKLSRPHYGTQRTYLDMLKPAYDHVQDLWADLAFEPDTRPMFVQHESHLSPPMVHVGAEIFRKDATSSNRRSVADHGQQGGNWMPEIDGEGDDGTEPTNAWDLALLRGKRRNQRGMISNIRNGSESDFWGGRCSSPRAPSIRSCSSSKNSSLRGSQVADPEEQDMTGPKDISSASSMDLGRMSPTLVPPPVQLGKDIFFTCDICGQAVTAARRLEWQ
ncbi:MAG: hypothetical protein Q9213_004023 [Squamulea squamosa]